MSGAVLAIYYYYYLYYNIRNVGHITYLFLSSQRGARGDNVRGGFLKERINRTCPIWMSCVGDSAPRGVR